MCYHTDLYSVWILVRQLRHILLYSCYFSNILPTGPCCQFPLSTLHIYLSITRVLHYQNLQQRFLCLSEKEKSLHNIATQYCSKCDQMNCNQMLGMNFWALLSWGICVCLGSATVLTLVLHKWSCKDFGDLTRHRDLTYTSVHVILEDVSYSDDSLTFGTQSGDIHFLLLCWGLFTVYTLWSGFAGLPSFWTQPVPRSWENFFVWTNLNSAHWSFPLLYHQRQGLCTHSFSQAWIRCQSSVTLSAKDTRQTSKKSLWSPSV